MLPRTNCSGVTDGDTFFVVQGPHGIGNNSVFRPITTADDIACSGAGNANRTILKIGFPVGSRSDLSHGLAGTIRVMSSHRITLFVGAAGFMVLVALVRGDNDCGTVRRESTKCLEHVNRTHDISLIGLDGDCIGAPHKWLSRHMNHEIRPERVDGFANSLPIPNIGHFML